MQKDLFEKLMSSIEKHRDKTKEILFGINSLDDLKKKTLEEIINIVDFCQKEVDEMTVIAMTDLYHIIGMGNLSSVQLNKFIQVFKEYISYRPIVKDLSTQMDSISSLPTNLGKPRVYKLEGLDSSILLGKTDSEETVEEKDNVGDINLANYTKSTLPFKFIPTKGNILFDLKEADQVCIALRDMHIINSDVSLDTFKSKIKNGGSYCGITFNTFETGKCIGTIGLSTGLCKLRKTYSLLPD